MATSGQLCQSVAKALGVPFETVREHLRNIRRAGEITFKGHGRGAAAMTTLDASRLLITAVGSSFVKDSVETLVEFRKLQPLGAGKPVRGSLTKKLKPKIALDAYVADMMQRLIDERDRLPNAYRRPPQNPEAHASLVLTLMSVVSALASEFPRAAVVRYFTERGAGGVSFASPKWSRPVLGEAEYALQLPKAGLIQVRHVPAWTLAEIAHSL